MKGSDSRMTGVGPVGSSAPPWLARTNSRELASWGIGTSLTLLVHLLQLGMLSCNGLECDR